MSHEDGIEAASGYFDSFEHMMLEHNSREAVSKIIKAYLDASGMVMVPRNATDDMKSKGADAFFSPEPKTISDENERAASVWRRMINAAPNPFQTPEESREKK